jgi:hypothetical protein
MDKLYRVVVESESTTLAAVEDPAGGEAVQVPPGKTVAFEIVGEERFQRMTPMLVALDARDDFEVNVTEL